MALTTYGVKVPEELKQEATVLQKRMGLTGEGFLKELVTSYKIEVAKSEVPAVAEDLKELQGLTKRIDDIYLNLAYRIENVSRSKELEMQEQLKKKDSTISDLQDKLEEVKLENMTISDAFNNSVDQKNEFEEKVNQLTKNESTYEELNNQYKHEIETLKENLKQYKQYPADLETQKELLTISQAKNMELEKKSDKQAIEIERVAQEVKDLNTKHEDTIKNQQEKHKEELESLKDRMEIEKRTAMLDLKEKHQKEYSDKVKQLLEELEKSKKSPKSTANRKKKDTPKVEK